MIPIAPLAAAALAALAAWFSMGTVGLASPGGTRLAVLPLSVEALALAVAAGGAVIGLRRFGAPLWPALLLVLLLLPWLPFGVPAAFLMWVHPVSTIVWVAVFLLMVRPFVRVRHLSSGHPPLVAAALACLVFGVAAWRAAPMVPGGDEPHYLVITQSLLLDGDLTIEDVHRRGDYRAYYPGDLPPHVQRRGRNGEIYSIHAPGLPALVAPAFAVGGYAAVVMFLVLLGSAASALAWHLAWAVTGQRGAAWFGWAAVTLPITAIFQGFTVYPDGPGGAIALTGVWALVRAAAESRNGATRVLPWFLHGAALALLPWLHSRFAVLAGGLGALILLRLSTTRNPAGKAVAFLSVPAASAVLWLGFFAAIYGSADPSAPYAPGEMGSFAFVPGGLAGILFDQRFGLLVYAPVVAFAFAGIGLMLARAAHRRFALELLFVIVPYLLTVTHFAMWWGGWSVPARFFAPILPLLALPAGLFWTSAGRTGRVLASSALALTMLVSAAVIWVDRGRLAFNTRDASALWLQWAGRVADLTTAAPLWARETDGPLFRATAVWLAVVAAIWLGLRMAERSSLFRDRTAFHTLAGGALAVGAMAAASIVWTMGGASGLATIPSRLHLLERIAAEPQALALDLSGASRLPVADLPSRLRVELSRMPSGRSPGRDAPALFTLPPLPAGEYRVRISAGTSRGWVMVGITHDQFALRTEQLPAEPIDLRFPLPVRGLLIRGDEDARRAVRGLVVEPLSVLQPAERLTGDMARRAVRYGGSTVYFLDEGTYPEPEAFWVGGAREGRVVIQPDAPRASAVITLRNAPVHNRVTIEAGAWRDVLQLAPGEQRDALVPLDPVKGGGVLRFESSAGFRPSEHEAGNRDERFLGVWVKVEGR